MYETVSKDTLSVRFLGFSATEMDSDQFKGEKKKVHGKGVVVAHRTRE